MSESVEVAVVNGSKSGTSNGAVATQFKPGNTLSQGHGRPKGSVSVHTELKRALERIEKKKRKPFLDHVVERAYQNDKVIPPVLDRLIPRLGDPGASPSQIVINLVNFVVPPAA